MTKILIANDEPGMRELFKQILEDIDNGSIEILTSDNGIETQDIITSEWPELVLLDVLMPGMCGFEICNTVKRKLGMKDTTIIIISARAQVHDIKRGNDVGVDYYVTKPFDPDMILKMVTDVLSIR